MVSFQCHGCGDVVKKPKLDQHRSRCFTGFTGFDCIDCSKTFKSPAEYKGHTSCISEAEKYQKGLYKGPKTVANGVKSSEPPPPNSSSDKKDISHTPVSRQSNAQWNRNTQPTSIDNVNGYQPQNPQNGWRNGRDNHRYSDRGRKGPNRQQNRFTGSSASGANDTPLGISRRSSVDDPVVVNGGGAANGPSQANPRAEVSEAKGNPTNEKRKLKVVGSIEIGSSQVRKENPTEPDTAKAEKNSAIIHDDVNEAGKRKRKKEMNGEAGLKTGAAEADSGIKENVKKEKRRRERELDEEQAVADASSSGDKKKTKKVKRRKEATDEPNSVDEGDAGKKKKGKKQKDKNADDIDKAEITVAENVEIPDSVDEGRTKPKKRKKNATNATTNDVAGDSETPVVENAAAEVVVETAPITTKKKKKRATTDTISETATHVAKEEKQKKKKTRRVEDDDIQIDTNVKSKEKKRKRQDEPNDSTTEKRRKHSS